MGDSWLRRLTRLRAQGTALLAAATLLVPPAPAQKPYLSMLAVPSVLPADGDAVQALYLELLGAAGQAVAQSAPTTVALTSSDPAVAAVPGRVTLPAGVPLLAVSVTIGYTPGTATITAHSSGLAAAAATITTSGAAAVAGGFIGVQVSPAAFFQGGTGPAWLTVELENTAHAPQPARVPVTLTLVSSAPGVLGLPGTVTVPAGAYEATVALRTGHAGNVVLTALGDGYNAGIAHTEVVLAQGAPVSLTASWLPATPLPGTALQLVLQALDARGLPVAYPCGTVYLSSNDPSLEDVPASATPPCSRGAEAVVVPAGATSGTGAAAVTVAAAGLDPATVDLNVSGSVPTRLTAALAPLAFVYGGSPAGWLVLQATDAHGLVQDVPRPVTVTLLGGGAAVPGRVTLPAGASTVAVPIRGLAAGVRPQVVASAPGLAPVSIALVPPHDLLAGVHSGTGTLRTLTVFGRRIALRWVLAAQLALLLGLGLFLLRHGRRAHA